MHATKSQATQLPNDIEIASVTIYDNTMFPESEKAQNYKGL